MPHRQAMRPLAATLAVFVALATTRAFAAPPALPASPPGLALKASPTLADVGGSVSLAVTATAWPAPATVTVSFLSAHHGFTGRMAWSTGCSCFRVAVALARRIHPLERAKAVATVIARHHPFTVSTSFLIRGLAPSGKEFAPGGTPSLRVWVGDPTPNTNQSEHYCAWVTTADGLGVAGLPVHFVVHFQNRTQMLSAGSTNKMGIACSGRSIGFARTGRAVRVDVYAGKLHGLTSFTPRAAG